MLFFAYSEKERKCHQRSAKLVDRLDSSVVGHWHVMLMTLVRILGWTFFHSVDSMPLRQVEKNSAIKILERKTNSGTQMRNLGIEIKLKVYFLLP